MSIVDLLLLPSLITTVLILKESLEYRILKLSSYLALSARIFTLLLNTQF